MRMACRAIPSAHGLARLDMQDSSAWTRASIPVAAVPPGGSEAVSSGSRIAATGRAVAPPT